MPMNSFLETIVFSTMIRPLRRLSSLAALAAGMVVLPAVYSSCAPADENARAEGCYFDSDCRGGRICVSANDQPLSSANSGKCVYGPEEAGGEYDNPLPPTPDINPVDSDIPPPDGGTDVPPQPDPQPECTDEDRDGFYRQEGCGTAVDFDDRNNTVYPGAPELCDYLDNNGNGQIDEGVSTQYFRDADGDGSGDINDMVEGCVQPPGYVSDHSDCNDLDESINILAQELCDPVNIDEDCDRSINEGCPCVEEQTQQCGTTDVGTCQYGMQSCDINGAWGECVGNIEPFIEQCNDLDDDCDGETDNGVLLVFYRDADGDRFGNVAEQRLACQQPAGYVSDNTDCDDSNETVNPSLLTREVCNGIDDNCRNGIDEGVQQRFYADRDGDGYGRWEIVWACALYEGIVNNSDDCNDQDQSIHPGAAELCDGRDNDCNGLFDEMFNVGEVCSVGTGECRSSDFYVCSQENNLETKCNAQERQPQPEICDWLDNDCDGRTDESVLLVFYRDEDGDGFGGRVVETIGCDQPEGTVPDDHSDCNDNNPLINPQAVEICDMLDNDCDWLLDENDTCGKIAFWTDEIGNGGNLYVVDADGGNVRNLTNEIFSIDGFSWSPDGSQLVYSRLSRAFQYELYIVNFLNNRHSNSTVSDNNHYKPSWSPDGNWIAFVQGLPNGDDVFVWDFDMGLNELRNLTNTVGYDSSPAWSPNSQKIVFVSERDGNREIYVVDANGNNSHNLTNNDGSDYDPVWSLNGLIAFVSERDGDRDVYIMDATGDNLQNLTNNDIQDLNPVWSPDGRKIAYSSSGRRGLELYVMNADGSNKERQSNNSGVVPHSTWSPNGGRIAFCSDTGIYMVDLGGLRQRELAAELNVSCYGIRWSSR